MWGGLFLAVLGFATIMTLLYVLEEAVVFSASIATAAWSLLAFTTELQVASAGELLSFDIGGLRYLFAGLALLSVIALVLDLFGVYRNEPDQKDFP